MKQSFFGVSIFSGKMTISETDRKHRNLLHVTLEFNDKVRPRLKVDKEKKRYALEKHSLRVKNS